MAAAAASGVGGGADDGVRIVSFGEAGTGSAEAVARICDIFRDGLMAQAPAGPGAADFMAAYISRALAEDMNADGLKAVFQCRATAKPRGDFFVAVGPEQELTPDGKSRPVAAPDATAKAKADVVLGFVGVEHATDRVCELRRMFVHKTARGLGLGRRLMQRVLDHSAAQGYEAVYLSTLAHFAAANAMYRRSGFMVFFENAVPVSPTVRFEEVFYVHYRDHSPALAADSKAGATAVAAAKAAVAKRLSAEKEWVQAYEQQKDVIKKQKADAKLKAAGLTVTVDKPLGAAKYFAISAPAAAPATAAAVEAAPAATK